MANENKWFVESETEVVLAGVRDEDGVLLDGTATLKGSINGVKNIPFVYGGSGGIFTGFAPKHCHFVHGHNYTMKVRVTPVSGLVFTVGITRQAELIPL